jgi:hypothetical protein
MPNYAFLGRKAEAKTKREAIAPQVHLVRSGMFGRGRRDEPIPVPALASVPMWRDVRLAKEIRNDV